MSRAVRLNQIFALNQEHKDILKAIKMFNAKHPYKAILKDFVPEHGSYETVRHRLNRLEKSDWIVIYRDDNRYIRGIDVLATA